MDMTILSPLIYPITESAVIQLCYTRLVMFHVTHGGHGYTLYTSIHIPVPVVGDPASIVAMTSEVGDGVIRYILIFIDEHL